MLPDVERHLSPATRVFTSDSFSPLLEKILLDLPLKDVLRASLVSSLTSDPGEDLLILEISKHINRVMADSAHIQLALRVILHQLSLSETHSVGNHGSASYGAALRRLLEREHRLSTWTPKEIRCLHLPHSRVIDVRDGYILFEEHASRERTFVGAIEGPTDYETVGWTVWKLSEDETFAQTEAASRGRKHQGLSKWTGILGGEGGRVQALAFCPQDNVVAVARRFGPVHSDRLNAEVFVNRFFFYTMRSGPSAQGTIEAHEEAELPYIELLTEDVHDVPRQQRVISMQVIPGGRMLVKIDIDGDRELGLAHCTAWDWKNGICLGRMCPWDPCQTIFSVRFLTPDWVVCATFRTVDIHWEEQRYYDFGFEEGEYGGLLGFDVFALDREPHMYSGPFGIGHGNDLFSKPCSWSIWSVKPARRLCILYLPPIRQHPSYEDWAFDDDFRPRVFNVACPVTTRLRRHMPEVFTFSMTGRYSLGPHLEELQVMQGVIPVRVILAAALCGAMRNFALDESTHGDWSSSGDGDDGSTSTSSKHRGDVETSTSGLDQGLGTSSEDFEAFMHTADGHLGHNHRDWPTSGTRSNIHNSELDNYWNGPSSDDEPNDEPVMIPWSILCKYCDLSCDPNSDVPSSHGSRVLSVSVDLSSSSSREELSFMSINDYSHLALPATRLLRKPLAALYSKCFGPEPVETVTRRCPLPKPFKLPHLSGEKSTRTVSDSRVVVAPGLFAQKCVQVDVPYLSRWTKVSIDVARPLENVHFDGDRIILTTVWSSLASDDFSLIISATGRIS